MTKKFILFAFIAVMLFGCISKKETNDISTQLDEFLTGQSKYFRFNGNVLVAENGEIVFQKSYGFADFKTKRLLNDSSVFELASISKQFTATAILLLKDKGKLQLTDSLRQYFPELPYSGITIYQMLTHSSGLPDFEYIMFAKWDHSKIAFNNDMIALLAKEKPPLRFPPGTGWEYNNTAYAILASIIEKVSGQSFKEYMAINIFKPLQMTHTDIYNTRRSLKDTLANYAYGIVYNDSLKNYFVPDSLADKKFVVYMDGIQGDIAVNSTTADLLKWDRSIKKHTLLSKSTQKDMLDKQVMIDTLIKSHYGFGVYLTLTDMGNFIFHSGEWPGYITFLARNVDNDQTFIVLSNNQSSSRHIGMALNEIINGRPIVMPYEHKEIMMDSTIMQQFIGRYKAQSEFTIERIGNNVFRVSAMKPMVELKPESATKFFYGDGTDRQIEFELDNNNKVIKAWLISYGTKNEYLKK
jgi:CubicO group peptidase (beta-lactamase class C family)